jgi:hypothetical protein
VASNNLLGFNRLFEAAIFKETRDTTSTTPALTPSTAETPVPPEAKQQLHKRSVGCYDSSNHTLQMVLGLCIAIIGFAQKEPKFDGGQKFTPLFVENLPQNRPSDGKRRHTHCLPADIEPLSFHLRGWIGRQSTVHQSNQSFWSLLTVRCVEGLQGVPENFGGAEAWDVFKESHLFVIVM